MVVRIQKTTALAIGGIALAALVAAKSGVFDKARSYAAMAPMKAPMVGFGVNPPIPVFSFNLGGSKPMAKGPGGSEVIANADVAPILEVPRSTILARWAISVGILRLEIGGVREPHWHPNASEIGYILDGNCTMTIFVGGPATFRQSFTISAGEAFYVPSGFFHHIENIGNGPATVVAAWNNERPQTQGLSGMIGSSPKDIVEKSMGMRGSGFFNGFNNDMGTDIVIGQKAANAIGPQVVGGISQQVPGMGGSLETTKVGEISQQSPFKFALEMAQPGALTQAGFTKMGFSPQWPALQGQGQAVFSITLHPNASREPHWHQQAGELHFVHFGTTRYLVTAPGGMSEVANLSAGEFFYAPPGYLHTFENIGNTDLHVVSFFTNDNPGDIGLTGGMSSYTDAVLGATFNRDPAIFAMMKRYDADQAIVGSPGSTAAGRL